MKLVGVLLTLIILPNLFFAQLADESAEVTELDTEKMAELEAYIKFVDSVDKAMNYLYAGESVQVGDGIATLLVPEGYKYLGPEQSQYTLTELWGNPKDEGTLGMIFQDSASVFDNAYAIEITYEGMGYVDDEEAEDLDYDELLETMQEEAEESNEERVQYGYPRIELIGWAAEPYYDQAEKKLHWAKELAFEGEDSHTLNYNVRVLGRKGVLQLNFIAGMDQLEEVSAAIPSIMPAVNFNDGMRYRDFDPELDKVAAVGIGGLIAGKVLAKTGFLAILAKFGKFIIIAVVGFFAMLRKRIFGGKSDDSPQE
ncbi:MAG: DUF2167 domain-containing protein [Bacteroidota bacterium]